MNSENGKTSNLLSSYLTLLIKWTCHKVKKGLHYQILVFDNIR